MQLQFIIFFLSSSHLTGGQLWIFCRIIKDTHWRFSILRQAFAIVYEHINIPFPPSDDNRLDTIVYKVGKRDRPPKGFYNSLEEPVDFLVDRSRCEKKTDILGICQAERVVAKKRNPILKSVENSLRHSL